MLKDQFMGHKKRYVRSDANCQVSEKRISFKSYPSIIAFFVALIAWLYNPSDSIAGNQYICYALANHGNRITSTYLGSYSVGTSILNNRPISLPLVRDFCHDSGAGYYTAWNRNDDILATRVISLPDTADHTDHIQSWDMSQVANKLGCSASAGGQLKFPGINQVIALLPQSPANMRIPTLINKMAGENSLAGNLAIELYSGVWQFLGILTSFKLFKVFFKGG